MAAKGNSSSERATRWDVLLSNLKPSLSEMPHMADDFKTLDELLSQARGLETQREDLKSQARAAGEQLQKTLRQGDKVRARMGSSLKGKFGFTDATLVKYGFRPIPPVRRRKNTQPAATKAEGTPATAPQGTHPAPAAGTK